MSFSRNLLFLALMLVQLAGCSGQAYQEHRIYKTLSREDHGNNFYKGHYKIGKKYKIKGKTYRPKNYKRYSKVGIASWYGSRYGFHGKKTANGDIYNKYMLTAAHKTLPLPSLVKVHNLENNRSLIVLVNDRGPYAYNRIIDLSEKAASLLGMRKKGTAKVRVTYLSKQTNQFLEILGLKKKHGSLAKQGLQNEKCSVNCHIKLINIKHKHKNQNQYLR